ncbi:MAG: DUF799 domain-containing protein [Dysgonamonadaceae bacterium]|jgi:hypothetical protein|nr:DUF799 domain-containing protein [Dysgonamonadaceae bacterium]
MKMNKWIALLSLAALFLVSCGPVNTLTKQQTYPNIYSERPLAIAVMPPINNTNNVEAKEFLFLTLAQPLCEKGYYVLPSFLSMEMFKSESAYDADLFINSSVNRFGEILGADAVLFTIVNKWEKMALSSNIYVEIEYRLKSTHTNEILFERKGNIIYDASINSGSGGLFGALIDMAASAINTALTDHIKVARICNTYTLSDIPAGVYSPDYNTDQMLKAGLKEFRQTVK